MTARPGRVRRARQILRPLLGPAWRRIRPLVRQESRWSPPVALARWRARLPVGLRHVLGQPGGVPVLERWQVVELARTIPYYAPRIAYLSAAAGEVRRVARLGPIDRVIEIGPHLQTLVAGSDVIDVAERPELSGAGRVTILDAKQVPWPIADRAYDLLVALQVWEHLPGRQREAFLEVRRVARHAILSLPIGWTMKNPSDIHHRITHEQALAWFAPVVPTRVVVGNRGSRTRLIYVFENLPPPD